MLLEALFLNLTQTEDGELDVGPEEACARELGSPA